MVESERGGGREERGGRAEERGGYRGTIWWFAIDASLLLPLYQYLTTRTSYYLSVTTDT